MSIPIVSMDPCRASARPLRLPGRAWPRLRALVTAALCTVLALGLLPRAGAAAGAADDPEALYRDAEAMRAAKNPGAAEMLLQRLVRVAPDHVRGRLALARVQLERSPAEALETLDAARAPAPNEEEVHWLRGRALEALGRLPEAAEAYRQAIRIDPRRVEINQRLRQVLRALGGRRTRVEEASQRFYATPNLATLSLFGRLLLDEATPQEALTGLQDARRRVPALPEINLWIARAQRLAGSLNGETEAYERYLAADPGAAGVRLLLAVHLEERGRLRQAEEALAPFDRDARLLAGLDSADRARLAYVRSRTALARNDAAGAARGLGEAARLGMEPAVLRAAFQNDLVLRPDEPELWIAYAQWLERTRQYEQAADAWMRAGLLDANHRAAARQALAALQDPAKAPAAAAEGARVALARLALAEGQPREALRLAEAAPASPAAQRRRLLVQGLAYRALGDLTRSLDAFTAYVLFETDAAGMARARGWLLWELGEHAEAVAAWRERPEALAASPELLALSASHLQSAGDTQAEQAVRQQLAALPAAAPANLVRLGDLYSAQGRMREALAQWDAALAQDPLDYDLLIRVTRQRFAQGDMEAGTERLLQANDLRPVPAELALLLADWWRAQGRLEQALSVYWQVYRELPREPKVRGPLPELAASVAAGPEVRRGAARLALETGRPELAASLLRAVLLERPADTESRVLLADLYERAGRAGEAEALLRAAQPPLTGTEHLRVLARLQREAGHAEALAGTLERLAQLEPGDAALARERGLILVRLGRMEEADAALAPLAGRTGGDPELTLALAQVDLARGRAVPAEAHLREVLTAQPDQPDAHRLLRRLYELGRRWEELSGELEYQVGRNPRSAELREAVITAYLRASTPAPARPHYDALRALDAERARPFAPYFP